MTPTMYGDGPEVWQGWETEETPGQTETTDVDADLSSDLSHFLGSPQCPPEPSLC